MATATRLDPSALLDDAARALEDADPRDLARWFGWTRVALGVAAFLTPRVPAAPWIGRDESAEPANKVLARALGGRDIAIGLGAVLAVERDGSATGWVEAGGLADAGDCLITLWHWRSLPRLTRWGILAITGGSAVFSLWLAGRLRQS